MTNKQSRFVKRFKRFSEKRKYDPGVEVDRESPRFVRRLSNISSLILFS